ncbi:MAG: group I intron-associated PD-(D/E)XK endonuclease [Nitrospiria bacterium]
MQENILAQKQLVCFYCKKAFVKHQSNPNCRTKYCSAECSTKAKTIRDTANRQKFNLGARLGLSSGKIGKISELVVAIDLLKKGWNVHTAFEDTHPFDILAIKGNRTMRIEVKSGRILPSGLKVYAMKKGQGGKHDILAIVTNLNDIEYHPDINLIETDFK